MCRCPLRDRAKHDATNNGNGLRRQSRCDAWGVASPKEEGKKKDKEGRWRVPLCASLLFGSPAVTKKKGKKHSDSFFGVLLFVFPVVVRADRKKGAFIFFAILLLEQGGVDGRREHLHPRVVLVGRTATGRAVNRTPMVRLED